MRKRSRHSRRRTSLKVPELASHRSEGSALTRKAVAKAARALEKKETVVDAMLRSPEYAWVREIREGHQGGRSIAVSTGSDDLMGDRLLIALKNRGSEYRVCEFNELVAEKDCVDKAVFQVEEGEVLLKNGARVTSILDQNVNVGETFRTGDCAVFATGLPRTIISVVSRSSKDDGAESRVEATSSGEGGVVEERLRFLREKLSCGAFKDEPLDNLRKLVDACTFNELPSGSVLEREGTIPGKAFFIMSGFCALLKALDDDDTGRGAGRDESFAEFARVGPGAAFGQWSTAPLKAISKYSIVAATPVTCLSIDTKTLKKCASGAALRALDSAERAPPRVKDITRESQRHVSWKKYRARLVENLEKEQRISTYARRLPAEGYQPDRPSYRAPDVDFKVPNRVLPKCEPLTQEGESLLLRWATRKGVIVAADGSFVVPGLGEEVPVRPERRDRLGQFGSDAYQRGVFSWIMSRDPTRLSKSNPGYFDKNPPLVARTGDGSYEYILAKRGQIPAQVLKDSGSLTQKLKAKRKKRMRDMRRAAAVAASRSTETQAKEAHEKEEEVPRWSGKARDRAFRAMRKKMAGLKIRIE